MFWERSCSNIRQGSPDHFRSNIIFKPLIILSKLLDLNESASVLLLYHNFYHTVFWSIISCCMMNFDEVNLIRQYLLCTQRQTTGWTSWGERGRFCLPLLLRASITESAPFRSRSPRSLSLTSWTRAWLGWRLSCITTIHYTLTSDAHYFVVNSEHLDTDDCSLQTHYSEVTRQWINCLWRHSQRWPQ